MSGLKRKESLREAYARKLRDQGRYTTFDRKTERSGRVHYEPKRHKPLKKQSRRERERLKQYFPIRNAFLQRAENAACAICLCRGVAPAPATEVHHKYGRNGNLLFDTRGFVPSCRGCREYPNEHAGEARRLGVLGEAWEYGVPIDQHREKGCEKAQNMRDATA